MICSRLMKLGFGCRNTTPRAFCRSIDSEPAAVMKITLTRGSPWNSSAAVSEAAEPIPPMILVWAIFSSSSLRAAISTRAGEKQVTIHCPSLSARNSARSATLLLGSTSLTCCTVKPSQSSPSDSSTIELACWTALAQRDTAEQRIDRGVEAGCGVGPQVQVLVAAVECVCLLGVQVQVARS